MFTGTRQNVPTIRWSIALDIQYRPPGYLFRVRRPRTTYVQASQYGTNRIPLPPQVLESD